MLSQALKRPGKIPRASFVMAFVKRDELSKFILEGQPIKAIARLYDRNPDTVQRAIDLLKTFEKQIAAGDIRTVAGHVWRGQLGWERSPSFIQAKEYLDRGELMPKETCGPAPKGKVKTRRKPEKIDGPGTNRPAQPPPIDPLDRIITFATAPAPTPLPTPVVPTEIATSATQPQPVKTEQDDFFSELSAASTLLHQAQKVAATTKIHK